MALYDVFAETNVNAEDPYLNLLLKHANDCGNGQTSAKAELTKLSKAGSWLSNYGNLKNKLALNVVETSSFHRLPAGSLFLEFQFKLRKRYLSRDDMPFYPTDNPIRKEFIFKLPMVAASTWKGSLRAAAVELFILNPSATPSLKLDLRLALIDVFGDEKRSDGFESEDLCHYLDNQTGFCLSGRAAKSRQGRLIFFPSYFETSSMDVINPRNPTTRVGDGLITMESVPKGSRSFLRLLYVPFDLIAQPPDEVKLQLRRDWTLIILPAISHMFHISGFGAKKSNGCGRAEDKIEQLRLFSRGALQPNNVQTIKGLGNLGAQL